MISDVGNRAPVPQTQNSSSIFDQIRPQVATNIATNIASNMSDRQMVTYLTSLLPNPSSNAVATSAHNASRNHGFCEAAWRVRTDENHAGRSVMPAAFSAFSSTAECHTCGARWTWPRTNGAPNTQVLQLLTPQFFFESHLPPPRDCTPLQGCLVCWELDGKWHEPMGVDHWLAHMSGHLNQGYVACTAMGGGKIRRRAECQYKSCPRFHA